MWLSKSVWAVSFVSAMGMMFSSATSVRNQNVLAADASDTYSACARSWIIGIRVYSLCAQSRCMESTKCESSRRTPGIGGLSERGYTSSASRWVAGRAGRFRDR